MDYDHKAINLEIMKYYETNKISLDDIWKDMENHKELVPYLNLLGYYYYVEIYKYNECTIASEAANLERQYKEKAIIQILSMKWYSIRMENCVGLGSLMKKDSCK